MVKFLDLKALNLRFEPDMTLAIQHVINSGWFILGEEVKTFEKNYADFIGVKYCVGVANGLDALSLILKRVHDSWYI
jgi:dTDP-4-amino-4,6-dideoxygalactose transaminase